MKIHIYSRKNALINQYNFHKYFGIISLTTPNSELPKFDNPYAKVLFLQFDDVIVPESNQIPINDGHAKQILEFMETWKDKIEDLIVHCEAGICRSAGAGAAISLIYNGSDKWVFDNPMFVPNHLVYRTILNNYYK